MARDAGRVADVGRVGDGSPYPALDPVALGLITLGLITLGLVTLSDAWPLEALRA